VFFLPVPLVTADNLASAQVNSALAKFELIAIGSVAWSPSTGARNPWDPVPSASPRSTQTGVWGCKTQDATLGT
jgi:hypothetical protein